jgi:hypothetical protein
MKSMQLVENSQASISLQDYNNNFTKARLPLLVLDAADTVTESIVLYIGYL